MGKTRTGKIATGLAIGGFFFVLLAFTTPSWLVTDGILEKPNFEQLGMLVFMGVSTATIPLTFTYIGSVCFVAILHNLQLLKF